MIDLVNYIKKVAKTDASILIRGESGTGKRCLPRWSIREELPQSPTLYLY